MQKALSFVQWNKNIKWLISTLLVCIVPFSACETDDPVDGGDGGGDISAGTITLDCSALKDITTFENSAAAVDYLITCDYRIDSDITIEAGTVIAFEEGKGIGVETDGSLTAIGTASNPIVFRGEERVAGYWDGVWFKSNSSKNILDFVLVSDAGHGYVFCCYDESSVAIVDGRLSITNTTINNGEGHGLFMNDDAVLALYEGNAINNHKGAAIYMNPNNVAMLDGMGSSYSDNVHNVIRIDAKRLTESQIWTANEIPYQVDGSSIGVDVDLELADGVDLTFQEGGSLAINENGSFKVSGTAASPVRIRGEEAVAGWWKGIAFKSNSTKNVINFAEISDGGSGYVYCCSDPANITVFDGRVSLTNSSVTNSAGFGLLATNADVYIDHFEGNSFRDNKEAPLYVNPELLGRLDGTLTEYVGNDDNFIRTSARTITTNQTWRKSSIPYKIDGENLYIEGDVFVNEGAEIVFQEDGGIGVQEDGTLKIGGTASNPVIIRGADSVPGYWKGVYYSSNRSSNTIDFANFSDGGGGYVFCCDDGALLGVHNGGSVTVNNASFSNSQECGIFIGNNATMSRSSLSFNNNTTNICED